ncbi:hypothetical protein, partial [Nonomuraea sp. SBT364]|uniref:hypothetical protein n=1 Tax=Nonomuraea sp. SBT364 TaxID=1580530 RepID=UPI00066DC63C
MSTVTVGGHRLAEALHEGCCQVVDHLATSPSGRTVVVRHYGSPDRRRPDLAGVARLREAAPVGTVAVLGAGPDFVVTEYVEGGSLLTRVTPPEPGHADGPGGGSPGGGG